MFSRRGDRLVPPAVVSVAVVRRPIFQTQYVIILLYETRTVCVILRMYKYYTVLLFRSYKTKLHAGRFTVPDYHIYYQRHARTFFRKSCEFVFNAYTRITQTAYRIRNIFLLCSDRKR